MILDQVEGFFAGFGAGVGRILMPLLAVGLGAMTCACTSWDDFARASWILWLLSFPFLIAFWLTQGLWGIIGLLALGALLTATCSFALENNQKRNFYVIYAASTVYYSLGLFRDFDWVYPSLIFILFTVAYWFLPPALDQIRAKGSQSGDANQI